MGGDLVVGKHRGHPAGTDDDGVVAQVAVAVEDVAVAQDEGPTGHEDQSAFGFRRLTSPSLPTLRFICAPHDGIACLQGVSGGTMGAPLPDEEIP
jgi:hypothetical protein